MNTDTDRVFWLKVWSDEMDPTPIYFMAQGGRRLRIAPNPSTLFQQPFPTMKPDEPEQQPGVPTVNLLEGEGDCAGFPPRSANLLGPSEIRIPSDPKGSRTIPSSSAGDTVNPDPDVPACNHVRISRDFERGVWQCDTCSATFLPNYPDSGIKMAAETPKDPEGNHTPKHRNFTLATNVIIKSTRSSTYLALEDLSEFVNEAYDKGLLPSTEVTVTCSGNGDYIETRDPE